MDTFILPPASNWLLSNILACNDDGLLAYGSNGELSFIDCKEDGKINVSFINVAHKEKVNVVVFSPIKGKFCNCLATCGDDGMVRVWDFKERRLLICHSGHKDGLRVTGLDWSRADTNLVVSVNDLGSIVCWDLASNTIRRLHCGVKTLPTCLACCPHDANLIAIGCKGGGTLLVNIKGNGKIIHRLRGNEHNVVSISWCPVPYNVIKDKNCDGGDTDSEKEKGRHLLLATGSQDKNIFIWRTDGRYETVLNLPSNPMTKTVQRKKGNQPGTSNFVNWTCVLWVDAYTLLSTNQYAELLAWDLKKVLSTNKTKPLPRLLNDCHKKGCFSIACPVNYELTSTWKESRVVWTSAMDKHIVATSLGSGSVVFDIPTLGGHALCMAISPQDPNRLAIGSGDSKIFVWNISNLNSFTIDTYRRKIVGKVMTLAWHPSKEDLLAYGTSDGHIGLLEVGSSNSPILLRLHIRSPVYRICWAPPILKSEDATTDSKELVVFAAGDWDVYQFNSNQPDQEPKSLNEAFLKSFDKNKKLEKTPNRSDVAFKTDHTCFAVASENGSVYIIDCESLSLKCALYPHQKIIYCLKWHPATVACDNNLSPYQHWLATSSDNIKVYNIPPDTQPELVASLKGHSEKITSLAWSPHFNGRLVSASFDCTAQVWDVPKQSCIAVCYNHLTPVMCALFNPDDPDVIISGATDTTVQFWSISKMNPLTDKPDRKKKLVQLALRQRSDAMEATELTVDEEADTTNKKQHWKSKSSLNSSMQSNSSSKSSKGSLKGSEDKKNAVATMFPVTGPSMFNARHFDVLWQRKTGDPVPSDHVPSVTDLGYLDFFGDDRAMHRLLMMEEDKNAMTNEYIMAQQAGLWRGDVSQMVREAIEKKRLNDWLLSISPMAGFQLWEEACEKYAAQLSESGQVTKASSYLLAIHKVHEAVQMLIDGNLHREAVAVAKCRLAPDDPLIVTAYRAWGVSARFLGQTLLSAHCFLAAGDLQECVDTLVRIKELRWLLMAANIARHAGYTEQANSLAAECMMLCISSCNFIVGDQLLSDFPEYNYLGVWLRASEMLVKMKSRSERDLFAWLEGRQAGQLNLFSELTAVCAAAGPVYHQLLPHLSNNKTPEFERDMWTYMSGQLTAACAARLEATPALYLRHTVSAVSAAYHFQTGHPKCLALPLTQSLLSPNGLFAEGCILKMECNSTEEKQLLKSLRAFVSASIVLWMHNNWQRVKNIENKTNKTDSDSKDYAKMMTWLPEILESCSADMLDSENVAFFVKKAQQQHLQNIVNKEKMQSKCSINKVESSHSSKVTNGKIINDNPVQKCSEEKVTTDCVSSSVSDVSVENLDVSKDRTVVEESNSGEGNQCSINNENESESSSDSSNTSNNARKDDEKRGKASNVDLNDHIEITQKSKANNELPLNSDGSAQDFKLDQTASDNKHNGTTGSDAVKVSEESSVSKLNELKELNEAVQRFEADRVSIPSPFSAYVNIKYLLDNVVSKQDANLAQHLLDTCDKLWKKSQQ